MVNEIACQKQAPKQKWKPEMSPFFIKKSFIIYQSFKLKVSAVGLHLNHTYMDHACDSHLDHTYTQTRPYFCLRGIMEEYSFMSLVIVSSIHVLVTYI